MRAMEKKQIKVAQLHVRATKHRMANTHWGCIPTGDVPTGYAEAHAVGEHRVAADRVSV